MSWLKVTLPRDAFEQAAKWKQIQDTFEHLFMAAGGPRDAAMFAINHRDGAVTLLFSPASEPIAGHLLKGFGAAPAERPIREGTTLLVGHSDAGERLLA